MGLKDDAGELSQDVAVGICPDRGAKLTPHLL